MIESNVEAADNAGAVLFKAITIKNGFRRRYAGLGELIGVVAQSLKSYAYTEDPLKLAKLAKKVKYKRKIKNKRKRQPNMRPYLGLIVSLKKATRRENGTYIKFDKNRVMTFTEPTKFGPAGKTENIPNFIGTKALGPVCIELCANSTIKARFKSVITASGGVV